MDPGLYVYAMCVKVMLVCESCGFLQVIILSCLNQFKP